MYTHLKILVVLFALSPYLSMGKMRFRGDTKKEIKIIHSDSPIIKLSDSLYCIYGNLNVRIWSRRYLCDSAVFNISKKELKIFRVKDRFPKLKPQQLLISSIDNCPNLFFWLSENLITSDCPAF